MGLNFCQMIKIKSAVPQRKGKEEEKKGIVDITNGPVYVKGGRGRKFQSEPNVACMFNCFICIVNAV